MSFLSLIVVLALVQWWGSGQPLHRDNWFFQWSDRVSESLSDRLPNVVVVLAILAGPVLLLILMMTLLVWLGGSSGWLFFVNIPVLLYSLGRGRFTEELDRYLVAVQKDDSVKASHILDAENMDPPLRRQPHEDNWTELHREALRVFCYRGFERMFAVLFWFLILGAPGALAYRLLSLYWSRLLETNHASVSLLSRWLVVAEWPAARLLGLTWALVGNFEFCMRQWREKWWTVKLTPVFLVAALRGALGATDKSEPCADGEASLHVPCAEPSYSLQLLTHLVPMFSRALWAWIAAVAVLTLMN